MMLRHLLKKKTLTVIGLNSGTSADGLDLAAVKINISSQRSKIQFLTGRSVPYPKRLSQQVYSATNDRFNSIDEIVMLDRELGVFFGEQAAKFISSLRRKGIRPDLIGSHGQTIRHLPGKLHFGKAKESASLQLGHPESIAERTRLVTVADFRQSDIAAGGEGAPITAHAMWRVFGDIKKTRLLVNIGGIANYFLLPAGRLPDSISARDCGPGNSLLDILAARLFGKKYDPRGRLAARGGISWRLLSLLLADNYLKGKYGSSTGRERFGEKFVDKILSYSKRLNLDRYGIMATATELTAVSIASSLAKLPGRSRVENIYVFGGGAKNNYLMERLIANLKSVSVLPVDRMGYDADYVEAVCYAVMGAMTVQSLPGGLPRVSGAARKTVGGRIVQP